MIEFDRKPLDPLPLRGFVLSWNRDFTLIHVLDWSIFCLNGYAIFRNSDVKRRRTFPPADFVARVVRKLRIRPSKPHAVGIGSMKEALRSAGSAFPLVTVYRERIDARVCSVGKFLRANQRTLTIRAISPQASWEEEASYSLRDITLLEFGGKYESLLHRIARPQSQSADS